MEQKQLDSLKKWFGEYVRRFYSRDGDEFLNNNLRLKERHTHRVCQLTRWLAGELKLNENDTSLAETVALFHDVGRFEQFCRWRTYRDHVSENHSLLGLRILREQKVLAAIAEDERQIIETAVEHHNAISIPPGFDDRTLLMAQIIRDADKLDIFELSVENLRRYYEKPAGYKLEIEFPDEPYCSAGLLESLMRGELVDYRFLRTMNDVKLLEIGWVYDIYFTATLRYTAENRYVERLTERLPDTREVQEAVASVLRYMQKRIEQGK